MVLCNMFFTSGSLLALLKFVESVSTLFKLKFIQGVIFLHAVSSIVLDIHIFVSYSTIICTIQAASIADKLLTTVRYHPYAILYNTHSIA